VKKTMLPRMEIIDFSKSSWGAMIMVANETLANLLDKKGKRSVELSRFCKEWMTREARELSLPDDVDIVRGEVLSECAKVLSLQTKYMGVQWTLYEWVIPHEDMTIAWCLASESMATFLSTSPSIQWSPLAVKRARDEQEEESVNMYDALLQPMTVQVKASTLETYTSVWSPLMKKTRSPRQNLSVLISSMFERSRLAYDRTVVKVGDRLDSVDLLNFDSVQRGGRVGSIGG
jgi:hypothetical protein